MPKSVSTQTTAQTDEYLESERFLEALWQNRHHRTPADIQALNSYLDPGPGPEPSPLSAMATVIKSSYFYLEGLYEAAYTVALEMVPTLKACRQPKWQARAHNMIAAATYFLGLRLEAIEHNLAQVTLAKELGDAELLGTAYQNLGWMQYEAGEYEESVLHFQNAIPLLEQKEKYIGLLFAHANMSGSLTRLGRYAEAQNHLDIGLDLIQITDFPTGHGLVYQNLGRLSHSLNRYEEGLAYFQYAIEIVSQRDDLTSITRNRIGIARIQRDLGQFDSAIDTLKQVISSAEGRGDRMVLNEAHELLARSYEESGQTSLALNAFKKYHADRESMYTERKQRQIQYLQIAHQFQLAEQEALLLKQRNIVLEERVGERTKKLEEMLDRELALHNQLEGALAKEAEYHRLKTGILNNISHEFRTPLTIINNAAALIQRHLHKMDDDKRDRLFRQITDQVFQINDLLNEISYVNLWHTQEILPHLEEILYQRLAEQLSISWGNKFGAQLDLTIKTDKSETGSAWVDINLMETIGDILLSNAIKFGGAPPVAEVHLFIEGESLNLRVSDNGVGIPRSDQDHIFDMFYRGSNISSRRGLGLGLYSLRLIVEGLNGRIRFSSGKGQVGTQFEIYLPLSTQL